MIEVFISMINKIRLECKITSAPAPREYPKNYNNFIELVKLWKKQGVKTFCFLINARLDRSGVIMASSMVSGNHWSYVHFNLETGDGIYADSIGRQVPRDFENTISNFFFKQYAKYKKKK